MSNDENSNESVDSVNESEESTKQVENEATNEVVEGASEVAEGASEVVEDTSNAEGNAVSKIMALKDSNPKVFFGGIAGLVIVVLVMMMSGGDNKRLPVSKTVNLSIGQSYSLKGVNTYDPMATIRLVAVPGSIAAYDDTEDKDRGGECKHLPQGTKVKLLQVQQAFGKAKFVEVEILDGECAGRKGWAVSNNLN